jgi:hypothetical protein
MMKLTTPHLPTQISVQNVQFKNFIFSFKWDSAQQKKSMMRKIYNGELLQY